MTTDGSQRFVVYVIDEDDAVRDSTRMLLEAHGYMVETYATGEEFLVHLAGRGQGCVLLGGHHLDAIRKLGRHLIGLPVVVITNEPDSAVEEEARHSGAVAVLVKPWHGSHLMMLLENARRSELRSVL